MSSTSMILLPLFVSLATSSAFSDSATAGSEMQGTKTKVVLHGVSFDPAQARLTNESLPVLNAAMEVLQGAPGATVVVAKTRQDGRAGADPTLERRRIESVTEYLRQHGITAARVEGEEPGAPTAPSSTTTGHGTELNPRVGLR